MLLLSSFFLQGSASAKALTTDLPVLVQENSNAQGPDIDLADGFPPKIVGTNIPVFLRPSQVPARLHSKHQNSQLSPRAPPLP